MYIVIRRGQRAPLFVAGILSCNIIAMHDKMSLASYSPRTYSVTKELYSPSNTGTSNKPRLQSSLRVCVCIKLYKIPRPHNSKHSHIIIAFGQLGRKNAVCKKVYDIHKIDSIGYGSTLCTRTHLLTRQCTHTCLQDCDGVISSAYHSLTITSATLRTR